jgi:ferric-dicitrate binding protein FerR (iron transport regulator)
MKEQHIIIGNILAKYPEISPEDQDVLDKWLAENEVHKQWLQTLTNENDRTQLLDRYVQMKKEEGPEWEQLVGMVGVPKRRRIGGWNSWPMYVAAACILLVFLTGAYFLFFNKHQNQVAKKETSDAPGNDVQPGSYKVKLTLSNGSSISIDTTHQGVVAQQGGITVINEGGKLVYRQTAKQKEILYNTLTTTKGETYATILSDGTKAWLNSQSSIHYPIAFNGDLRKVEITGEVFFEVAPSVAVLANGQKGKRPFIVKAPDVEIEVLGTHFNINSYKDEQAVKTTLLEGKVNVHSITNNAQLSLQPGEQAQLNRESQTISKAKDVDVDAEVAWHYGIFQFNNADLPTVMRQIARWYDVEVEYAGNISDREFLGKIPRDMKLSQVLSLLEKQKVHFKIEGKKIVVSP